MQQLNIQFETRSAINVDRMKGQNARLYEYLLKGNTIHVFHPAKFQMQIGYLNSRVSDLIKAGIEVHKRMIHVPDINGDLVAVKEYSLSPFPANPRP